MTGLYWRVSQRLHLVARLELEAEEKEMQLLTTGGD